MSLSFKSIFRNTIKPAPAEVLSVSGIRCETASIPRPATQPGDGPSPHSGSNDATPRIWIRPHYRALNGLRALAITLVFLVHYGSYVFPAALVSDMWVGVDLFFVMSGFLITGILYDSLQDPHFFLNFYIRRALRIFPLFYGFFLLVFVLTPLLHIQYRRSLFFYVFYVGNLVMPYLDLSQNNPTVILVPLGARHLNLNIGTFWTLCVEEQFYLLWPAVVFWARSRKRLMQLCAVGWLASLLCRVGIFLWAPRLLFFVTWYTYTRADTLFLGSWLALWLREQPLTTRRLHTLAATLCVTGLSGYFLARFLPNTRAAALYSHCFTLTAIGLAAAGAVLYCLDEENAFSRFLQIKQIAAFGAISYGFYFFHGLYGMELQDLYRRHGKLQHHAWIVPITAFVIAITCAKVSFHFYETPFLRLKKRLAPQWPGEPGLPTNSLPQAALLHVPEPQPDS